MTLARDTEAGEFSGRALDGVVEARRVISLPGLREERAPVSDLEACTAHVNPALMKPIVSTDRDTAKTTRATEGVDGRGSLLHDDPPSHHWTVGVTS
jgi:hypothetical protein